MTIDELRSAAAVVRDATEEGENTATRIGQLFLDTVNTLCNVSTNAIKGYVVINSTSDLPTSPTTDQQMKGYLLDTTLYVWVGTGGDTLDGKYQSAQLKGEDGKTGEKGDSGVHLGDVVLVNDLTTGGEGNALSAEMGKTLKGLIDSKTIHIVNDLTTGGEASALSAEQGKVLNESTCPTATVSIPFDGGGRYIARADGSVTNHSGWVSTQYIEVNEGDEFIYTGNPGNASNAVAGYELVDDQYVFKKTFVDYGNSLKQDVLIIIPSGITHIIAVTQKTAESSSSFTTKKSSALSDVTDNLGELASTTLIQNFVTGYYISKKGKISQGTSDSKYALFDVEIGDEISLYDYTAYGTSGNGEATISKQISDTEFDVLLAKEEGTYSLITYTATERMTIAVSDYRNKLRMLVVRRNKTTMWDATTDGLAQTRNEIEVRNEDIDKYDIKLGYMFENIACIGDSMSRGTLSSGNTADVDNDGTGLSSFGASWCSFLAKRWGCKSKYHYANSGTSAYMWLNNTMYGLGRMLTDTKVYNAYFIAYGHNDSESVGSATDEAAPVTINDNVPSCPSGYSFSAYYKAIINQIRLKAPHAMIFCLSEYDNVVKNSKTTYRQAVIDVAEWYYEQGDHLVHHLETGGVPDADMSLGTHYSTVGYAYIARMVDKCANEVVYAHRGDSEIKFFGSYNTDKTADSPWE